MNQDAPKTGVHNLAYIESLYDRFHRDAGAVPREWRDWFTALDGSGRNGHSQKYPAFRPRSIFNPIAPSRRRKYQSEAVDEGVRERLNELIRNYRGRGHRLAHLDPLGGQQDCPPELQLDYYGFTEGELDQVMACPSLAGDQPLSIREILTRLQNTYCRSIGAQFMHIDDVVTRQWLQHRMESTQNRLALAREEQLRIFRRLTDAVIFEEFLRRKFLGAKTFSLEGCETLLPMLDLVIEQAGRQGVQDVLIGMPHRGRLNVLAHIVGKQPCEIFREFADDEPELWLGRGDVRYHLGHSGEWTTADGRNVHLSLCFNPSHLEFILPVLLGRVRARQDRRGDEERRQVLGLAIHGDAAFAGEGIVQEALNFSKLTGYRTGGTLHIIVNNQIGFTTLPEEGRSTAYATDVARMLQAPIFHVNGEDPEAVAQVVRLSLDFRAEFQTDVFIDMYGYRRWGHNETDEPAFTQPLLYKAIESHAGVREEYLNHLLELKDLTKEEADRVVQERRENLETQLAAARNDRCHPTAGLNKVWQDYIGGAEPEQEPATAVPADRLGALLKRLTEMPAGFRLHPKLEHSLQIRRDMAEGKQPLDWSAAEALAFASLIADGVPLRLTGQDTRRGTFSQRHAVLFDQETEHPYVPLRQLAKDPDAVEILNSPLNEAGSLGFEYGYSLDRPDCLVVWEAQFGDFVNAAQVIIDQFLIAAEDKWQRLSGLVVLLPHGFEGMGPEHSSARVERFLALGAEDNVRIVQPSTPAQYFHCLRRQALSRWRKPLIVFTPKSLLRNRQAVSTLDDCAAGTFQKILPDATPAGPVKQVLLCTGKIYYRLAAFREQQKLQGSAIIRIEQLYPLSAELLRSSLAAFPRETPVKWVQEEPQNMGAWRYFHERFGGRLFNEWPLSVISRDASASPATGSANAHKMEEDRLVHRAFGVSPGPESGIADDNNSPKPNHVH